MPSAGANTEKGDSSLSSYILNSHLGSGIVCQIWESHPGLISWNLHLAGFLDSYPVISSWLWNRMLDLESYPGANIWTIRLCLLTDSTYYSGSAIVESEGLDKLYARGQRSVLDTFVHTCLCAHERCQPTVGMDHRRMLFNVSRNERIDAF